MKSVIAILLLGTVVQAKHKNKKSRDAYDNDPDTVSVYDDMEQH